MLKLPSFSPLDFSTSSSRTENQKKKENSNIISMFERKFIGRGFPPEKYKKPTNIAACVQSL
jgi:hypothetical protein